MIIAVTGKPGAGKTTFAVYHAIKMANKTNRKLYVNMKSFKCDEVEYEYISVANLPRVREGIVLLDEANYIFNSRFWDRISADTIRMWQMHRKKGIDIILTTHSLKRVDKILRELVQYEYRIVKFPMFYIVRVIDLDIERDKGVLKLYPARVVNKAWKYFDTLEEIK
ncbi:MAG: zonular occludens toxin domain-containing protein [Fervidobacterium sp.]|nr:zonular occludens toxin domain-containing protein [Fervidobacterium sp.]